MATDITSKASGQWDKLETIFEDRVAKALSKLGVPSAKEVNALIDRIDELNLAVQKLSGKASARKTTAKPATVAPIARAVPTKKAAPKAARNAKAKSAREAE
jgi:hypothetical protein